MQSQSGFSLLEIPIALFMISIMLLLLTAASHSLLLNTDTKYREIAHRIANNELEDVRAGGYSSVPASGSFTHTLLSSLPSGQATITTSNYNADTKQVTVTVSWQQVGAKSRRTITYNTLITRNGLTN